MHAHQNAKPNLTQKPNLSGDDNTISTNGTSSNRTHTDQATLITHVEGVIAIAEDLAVGSARAGVLADDLPVHTCHSCGDGTHVDVRCAGARAGRERGGRVAIECAGCAWEGWR